MSGQIFGPLGVLPTAGGGAQPTFTLTAAAQITAFGFGSNPSNFTINVGSAAVRRFVLGIQKDIRTITGITIGGNAMTFIVDTVGGASPGVGQSTSMYEYYDSTGSIGGSITIAVTCDAAAGELGIILGQLTGSTTAVAASGGRQTTGAEPILGPSSPLTLTTTQIGVAFFGGSNSNVAQVSTEAWSGSTQWSYLEVTTGSHTAVSVATQTAAGSWVTSISGGTGSGFGFDGCGLCCASWGP